MNKREKWFVKYFKRPLAYRVDKNDEKIYQRTIVEFITIIFLLVLTIVIYNQYVDIDNLKEDWLKILFWTLGISIPLIFVVYILMNNKLEKVRNIQKLAELIFTSGYYIKPQILSKNKKNENSIFSGSLVKSREDMKTLYFPKFYIKQEDNEIRIYIRLDGSKFQKDFLELDEKLEYTFNMQLENREVVGEYIIYTLSEFSLENRIEFSDKDMSDNSLKLMDNVVWHFRKTPHALIVGGTGSGKSYFMFYLIKEIMRKGYGLRIVDPKISDLTKLKHVSVNNLVVFEKEDVINLLDDVTFEMDNRYKRMLETSDNFGEDYVAYGMQPFFLVFDELLAFIATCESKEKKEVMAKLTNIIVKGRQAGVFVILATQRPDADVIDGKIRDQLALRVALGKMSGEGYKMIFGRSSVAFRSIDIKGSGYFMVEGVIDRPTFFVSPFVEKGDNVGKELMDLIKERGL